MRTVLVEFDAGKLLEGVKDLPKGGTINQCKLVKTEDGKAIVHVHYEHDKFPPNGCASDVILPLDEHMKLARSFAAKQAKIKAADEKEDKKNAAADA